MIHRMYTVERSPTTDRPGLRAEAYTVPMLAGANVRVLRRTSPGKNWAPIPSLGREFMSFDTAMAYCDQIVTGDAPEEGK